MLIETNKTVSYCVFIIIKTTCIYVVWLDPPIDTILYMVKHLRGNTSVVLMAFYSIVNLFTQIMSLLIGYVGLQARYYERFPVNNHFPLKT